MADSDEEFARRLQMEEDKEFEALMAARKVQCDDDHKLAQLIAEQGENSPVVNSPTVNSPNATTISISDNEPDPSNHSIRALTPHPRRANTSRASNTHALHTPSNRMVSRRIRSYITTGSLGSHTSHILNRMSTRMNRRSTQRRPRTNQVPSNVHTLHDNGSDNSGGHGRRTMSDSGWTIVNSLRTLQTRIGERHNFIVFHGGNDEDTDTEDDEDDDDDDGYDDDEMRMEEDEDEVGWSDETDEENEEDDEDDYDDEDDIMEGELGRVGRRGLQKNELDMLPTRTYKSVNGGSSATANNQKNSNECPVCISGFVDGDNVRILPCFHQFHSNCIDEWLIKSVKCPTCRVNVSKELHRH